MPFRLTILLLLAIFGAMYLAPEGPPRPDRVQAARPAADPAPPSAPAPAPDPIPERAATAPERPVASPPDRGDSVRVGPPTGDVPTVTAVPDAAGDTVTQPGPVTLPGIGFGDPGGDTAAALSLSDAARTRAAQAAADTLANAPDDPVVNSVSDAANDLLRGLVATDPAAPGPTIIRPAPADGVPRPTDPTPPPAGDIARVTGTAVNLRAGPSTANAVVGQVTFGQTLRVLRDTEDGWSEIENPANGELAYIASQFLETLP